MGTRGGAARAWLKPQVPSLVSLLNSWEPERQTDLSTPASRGCVQRGSEWGLSGRPFDGRPARLAVFRAGRTGCCTTPSRKSTKRFQPTGAEAESADSR